MQDSRALASVIGEDDLSATDKLYMKFGKAFENEFICQGFNENRTIEQSLDLGWKLLSILPRTELDRVSGETLDKYYIEDKSLLDSKAKIDLFEKEDSNDEDEDFEDN